MGKNKFEHNGVSYSMTPEEIEATYAYRNGQDLPDTAQHQPDFNALGTAPDIKLLFPDWKEVKFGEWSENGRILKYGHQEKDFIEIALLREPMDDKEYAGTYTLHIFDGDEVVLCRTVECFKEEK